MTKDWKIKELGDLCEIVNGSTPLRSNKEFWENGNFPWFTIEDIRKQGREIYETRQKVTELALSKLRVLPAGTVLLCCTASVGEYAIARIELTTNQQFNGLVIKNQKELSPEFLMHFCATLKESLLSISGKTTIDFIAISKLKHIPIPIPPLQEQQQIVSILDDAFATIDQAKANIEKNIGNAKELFQSKLNEIFSQKGEGWEEKTLKELTTKIGSGSTPRGGQASYKSEGISLVRSMNVHDLEFKERNLAYIDETQAKELNGVTLQEEDVLLNITGASVARCCVVPSAFLPARVNQHVSIIRPKKEIIDSRFLNLLLTSKPYKDQLLFTGEQGATRQAITKAQIEAFKIRFPDIQKQKEILQTVDIIYDTTQKLHTYLQAKLLNLDELKKSILQKAFSGELTSKKLDLHASTN